MHALKVAKAASANAKHLSRELNTSTTSSGARASAMVTPRVCGEDHSLLSPRPATVGAKPFKPAAECRLLSFGSDLLWERVAGLLRRAIVGRWKFERYSTVNLMEWLMKVWADLLGYSPTVSKLDKGWFCFHLQKDEDAGIILSRTWVNGRSFLAVHRWTAHFHPRDNAPVNHLVWVKLFGLPLHFWQFRVLKAIGDSLGRCYFADPKCHESYDKREAWNWLRWHLWVAYQPILTSSGRVLSIANKLITGMFHTGAICAMRQDISCEDAQSGMLAFPRKISGVVRLHRRIELYRTPGLTGNRTSMVRMFREAVIYIDIQPLLRRIGQEDQRSEVANGGST